MSARQITILVVGGLIFAVSGYFVGQWLASNKAATDVAPQTAMPSIPEKLPEFTLYNLADEAVTRADFEGKTVLFNFWATWCKPCRKEIPLLVEMQEKYADDGFVIVGVAIDNKQAVVKYLESLGGVNYPIVLGKKELDAIDAANDMGVDLIGLPISATVSADGRMQKIHTGELHREQVEMLIQEALAAGTEKTVADK